MSPPAVAGAPRDDGVLAGLAAAGVVPVVVLDEPAAVPGLARSLLAGGIGCAEITLRTPNALDVLAAAAQVPAFVAGAGTVLSAAQAGAAIAAGARFLVSPGLDDGVVAAGRAAGVPVLPGVATATEAMRALSLGVRTVKFFPAEATGGVAAVRALGGPLPGLAFLPTGGITAATAGRYLRLRCVLAVGGSWLTPPDLLAARNFSAVTRLARDATRLVGAARGAGHPPTEDRGTR
jgi:2-dehydro-3-deoxyphosphogluconate aldolase/(4S)-4-hydroxy-2-oxoglutarate aldolase